MKNWLLLSLVLLVCIQDNGLFAQLQTGPSSGSSDFVPNELIMRFERNKVGVGELYRKLASLDPQVEVTTLNRAGTDFLVAFSDDIPLGILEQCAKLPTREEELRCQLCELTGNPGSGSGLDPDALWPNYYVDTGTEVQGVACDMDISPMVICGQTPRSYRPLQDCSNLRPLPSARSGNGKEVHIAILDSGIDPSAFPGYFTAPAPDEMAHNTPQQNMVFWHPINEAQASDPESYVGVDPNGHGTAVARLAVSEQFRHGTEHTVKLHSFRVLDAEGRGKTTDLIDAISAAIDLNVDIINMSLGYRILDCYDQQSVLESYLEEARQKGILVFASAGNDGNDLAEHPQLPAAINDNPFLYTVGASNCDNEDTWGSSNYGTGYVDLTAPGERILIPWGPSRSFASASGTSFATPLAVSFAASFLSATDLETTICQLEARSPKTGPFTPGKEESRLGFISYTYQMECLSPAPFPDGVDGELALDLEPRSGSINSGTFPNPFNETLTVVAAKSDEDPTLVQLFDQGGNTVVTKTLTQQSLALDTRALSKGIYYVRLTNGASTAVHKVVKQ